MGTWRLAILLLTVFLAAGFSAKKKNPDDITQTLDLPKDPPAVAIGQTSRLTFHVSPLSAKGLLSQQTREALKAIFRENGGAQIIHIRAFVAGSGDLRRIPQIVSEVFTAKKMQLPSVSVVLTGALLLQDAQVVLETVSEGKKEVNPDGLLFIEAQPPDQLATRLATASAVLVTCFVSSTDNAASLTARFPSAAVDIVQTQRSPSHAGTNCEAVARGRNSGAAKLAFTGTQIAFGTDKAAANLAFEHLNRDLEAGGADKSGIVATNVYALSDRIHDMIPPLPGVLTFAPVEGVASADGTFAVDSIAAVSK
jgi:enamine deaminase RidA (YjgF/YER057c/UK114 family)